MSTTDLAIVCVTGVLVVFVAGCWSLAFFRGWRVIAPASNGKRGSADAAPAAVEGSPAAGAVPAKPLRPAS